MSGIIFTIIVIYVILIRHQLISMTYIGILVLPAPRRIPDRQCESANKKKNKLVILDRKTPTPTTSGSELKIPIRLGAKIQINIPMISARIIPAIRPKRAPSLALFYCLAPRFYPIKVVNATLKLVIGKNAKPSSFEKLPLPAMATEPN